MRYKIMFSTKFIMIFTILCSLSLFAKNVQAQDNSCMPFIDQVTSELATQCASTELGEICAGYSKVIFTVPGEEEDSDSISLLDPEQPRELEEILTIQTAPYKPSLDEWGVVYARSMANLSMAVAEENSMLYFLVGDVMLYDNVPAENLLIPPSEPLKIVTTDQTYIYSFPPNFSGRNYEIVGDIPSGTTLLADGVNSQGWIRVAYIYRTSPISRRSTAWIESNLIEANEAIATLPLIEQNSLTPLQSFSMIASDVVPKCDRLPRSAVLLQTPGNIEGEVYINGLQLQVFSTVVVQFEDMTESSATLRILTLIGNAFLPNPDSIDNINSGIVIPAGNYIDVALVFDELTERYILDSTFYPGFDTIKKEYDDAREKGERIISLDTYRRLLFWERLPPNLLNYIIELFDIRRPSGVGSPEPIIDGGIKPPLIIGNALIPETP